MASALFYQLQVLVKNNNHPFFFVSPILLQVRCSGSAFHTTQLMYLPLLGSEAWVWDVPVLWHDPQGPTASSALETCSFPVQEPLLFSSCWEANF